MNEETEIQNRIRLHLAENSPDTLLWRNNIGFDSRTKVHYGICCPGGADLIGLTSVKITQKMVGMKIALFLALEIKTKTGTPTDAQTNFINVVRRHGGIAAIVRSESEAMGAIRI